MEPEFYLAFLNDCMKSISDSGTMSQKQELLAKLNEKKKQIQLSVKPHGKKAPAPKPPPRLDDCTPPNGVSPCFDLRPVVSQQHISEDRESSPSPTKANNNVSQGKFPIAQ